MGYDFYPTVVNPQDSVIFWGRECEMCKIWEASTNYLQIMKMTVCLSSHIALFCTFRSLSAVGYLYDSCDLKHK